MTRTLAIAGAGFSGTLLALQVLRSTTSDTTIVLIERRRRFGQGAAYASRNPSHLLNVSAGNMSAFDDRPGDFLAWLQTRPGWKACTAPNFIPRQLYGAYIRHLLQTALRRDGAANRLILMRGELQAIRYEGSAVHLQLDRDRAITADLVVLATGNFPPEPPQVANPSFYDGPLFRANPWDQAALEGLRPGDPVLLIGTSLTAVDVVLSLLDSGHTGPITALSRRGLLPLPHASGPSLPRRALPAYPSHPLALMMCLRREAKAAIALGCTWQAAADAVRPFLQDLWQAMTPREQAAFLRHLRPWWGVHRHRIAPSIAARLQAAMASSQFCVRRGRIQNYRLTEAGQVEVQFGRPPKDGGGTDSVVAARVINCSGPSSNFARVRDPLLRSLLDTGLARPDRMRLGLDVTGHCAVRDASGAVSRQIFAVGPLTKGLYWEMTAVPDLRQQCESLANHLAGLLVTLPT